MLSAVDAVVTASVCVQITIQLLLVLAVCRLFALQAEYVLGSGRTHTFSYLIGYGKSSPTRPQHRLASCSKDGPCGVAAGLMAQAANPVQLKGGCLRKLQQAAEPC